MTPARAGLFALRGHRRTQSLKHVASVGTVHVAEHDTKLVASQPRDHVVATQLSGECLRRASQDLIAAGHATRVIHLLEAIQVNHGQPALTGRGVVIQVFQIPVPSPTISQTGQRIAVGNLPDRGLSPGSGGQFAA